MPEPERIALVTSMILERPLCKACIRERSGLSATDLDVTLARVRMALVIHDQIGQCQACGESTRVFALDSLAR